MLTILVLVPLFFVLFINLPLERPTANALAPALAIAACVLEIFLAFGSSALFPVGTNDAIAQFFAFSPMVDDLSRVMFLSIGIVGLVTTCVSLSLVSDGERRFNFTCLTLLAVAGMNGVVLATDLFSIYVFLEIVAVSSFILIAYEGPKESIEGTFKYFILSLG